MITFLAPFALLAASLLAIPVILHLFKPRKVRRTPFSSLRWLHLSQQKLARRIKWHQVLLFLLRAAFIALLVLAVAKPVLSRRGQGGSVTRFVVLDVSRSMGYRAGGRPAPIELGREAAASIINAGLPGDRTAVLLTGSTTRSLGPLSRDPSGYLAELKGIHAGASDTDLGSALQVIRPMLARRVAGAHVELDFITDNHQGSWREAAIGSFVSDMGASARVRVVDVGVPGAQNAWIADARLVTTSKPAALQSIRAQVGCIGDAGQSRTVRLSGLKGVPETSRLGVDPGNLAQVDLELPAGFDPRGQVARVSIEPGDGLPDDDEFFVNLDTAGATRVQLVESDSTRVESMRPGFYLRAALGALSAADGRPIELANKTSGELDVADVNAADVVLLADVPELSDAALAALEGRVKSGAGLAIFLGPSLSPEFYNTKLYRPLTPSDGLLAAPLKSVTNAPPQRLDPLTNINWAHPLLAPLYDPVLGDLGQTSFRSHYDFDGTAQNGEVLASIDGRAPAIVDRAVGAGRVVLFNTTANDAWGDLPRRRSFVPLIDRLLTYLCGSAGARRSFEVDQTVTLPLPGMKADAAVTVLAPGGKKLTPTVLTQAGRTIMRLDTVQDPGVYRIESGGGGPEQTFVVQAGRVDSVLTPIDAATLKKWWEPSAVEVLTPGALVTGGGAIASGRRAMWPWLVAGACLVLLAEMFLVHWLCPRMNPLVVESVVPRSGMLSSRTTRPQEVGV